MRIDKYLKVARILKRRSVSKELALHQRIEMNGKLVKPSHEVKVDDVIKITYGNRYLVVKVLSVEEVKKKTEASQLYEVMDQGYMEDTYESSTSTEETNA